MDLYEVIRGRRAIRRYRPEAVQSELIHRILTAAEWAPSGRNEQAREYLVVSGEKFRQMAAAYYQAAEIYTREWKDQSRRPPFLAFARNFGGAPLIVVVLTELRADPLERKMVLESASAAMQNLHLAAFAEGLGSCWMTGPLQNESVIREILGIPEEKEIVALMPVGYPAETPRPPSRRDPELSVKVRWV